MKATLIFLSIVFALLSCSNSTSKMTCSIKVVPLFHTDALLKPGQHVYYSVHNFDTANIDCYSYLENLANNAAQNYYLPVTIHFLDSLDNFQLPESGMYGSEDIRKRVIFQYLLLANQKDIPSFDPFGYNFYRKPE